MKLYINKEMEGVLEEENKSREEIFEEIMKKITLELKKDERSQFERAPDIQTGQDMEKRALRNITVGKKRNTVNIKRKNILKV